MAEPVAIGVLAKAPVAGLAKSRLIPALGAEGAAALAARMIEHTLACAVAAAAGPVTLWVTPDATDPLFQAMRRQHGVALRLQPDGDLGARMHAAVGDGPTLVIGTDCPALTANHLREAAAALASHDAVAIPVDDGGYVLIGLRRPAPALFSGMTWSTATVMAETRQRLLALGLKWRELDPLWDVDRPEDLPRLRQHNLDVALRHPQ